MEERESNPVGSSYVLEPQGGGTPPVGVVRMPGVAPGPPGPRRAAVLDGRTTQHSLLVMVPIRDVKSLETFLDNSHNGGIPFEKLATVHFGRMLIQYRSEQAPRGSGYSPHADTIPAKLLFATDFDGTLKDHLVELVTGASAGLDQLFEYCEGWPGLATRDRQARYDVLAGFVERHCVVANTFYMGTMKRSVTQIRREADLREAIEGFLDETLARDKGKGPGKHKRPTALEIRGQICEWIFNDPQFGWVHDKPGPMPSNLLPAKVVESPLFGPAVGLVVAASSIALLSLLVPFWWAVGVVLGLPLAVLAYVFYLSKHDKVIIGDVQQHTREMAEFEDKGVQNQLSTVTYIKQPLRFRRVVLKAVLAVINVGARLFNREGNLSRIPSIHFARWAVVDEGRRLLFFSNFDGSFESYLGDFIDKAHSGLTAIWSNCVGFPRTVGLTGGGASDEQRFKAIARQSQVRTHVWYSAYPSLTVSNINDNSRLRLGLYGEMNKAQAEAWLRMAAPRKRLELGPHRAAENTKIDFTDVQGLVKRSYPFLRHAVYARLTFPAHGADARAWLKNLTPDVTRADVSKERVENGGLAVNVAFTYEGLRLLGVEQKNVDGFAREFKEGMGETAHRQRLLGDTGDAAPRCWEWGRPDDPSLHAMLFLFARDEDALKDLMTRERDRAEDHGLTFNADLSTVWLDQDKEHFGFHDGIAQPRIAGFGGDDAAESGVKEVPTGEVLLGYENAYGVFPLSPTVPDDAWSSQHLDKPRDPAVTRARDLGLNGSYVVFRQLHQDVHAFWKYVDEHARREQQAKSGPPQNVDERRKFLAAKMVGRWPNGAPLAQYPDHEPSAAEVTKLADEEKLNAFFYSDTLDHRGDDLNGDRCPIGSHIRRTNPRDGMHPDTVESLKVADRHRLLRRGRAYGEPLSPSFDPHDILQSGGGGHRGLHFICFNTDIGRQFEFVQSTWANSAKFDGLYQDRDVLIAPATVQGPKEETSNFTMQGLPARQRCQLLPRFVTMIGGAYLFMPGVKAMRFLALDPRGSQNDPAGNRSSRD